MYIKEIYLKGYKWIDILGNIKEITITAMNIIQLVLGTNGSGKSSILQELSPFPARKGDYSSGGMKRVELYHDGSEYILTSDFSTKKGNHIFLKDGINLNVSGLSSLQMDLCQEHLKYSQLVDDITHCRYRISDMDISKRKSLILSISPSTPDFVVELHKQAKSLLRSCKNNINLLHTRKLEIEAQLNSDKELQEFIDKSKILEQEQINFSNEIYLLENKLAEYKQQLSTFKEFKSIDHYEQTVKDLQKSIRSIRFRNHLKFPIFEYDNIISEYQEELHQLKLDFAKTKEKYSNIHLEVTNYEQLLKSLGDSGASRKDILDVSMQRLKELEVWGKYPVIPGPNISHHAAVVKKLYHIIDHNDANTRWRDTTKLSSIKDKGGYIRERIYRHEQDILQLTRTIEDKKKFLTLSLKGPIDVADNCSSCDYMTTLSQQRTEAKLALKEAEKSYKSSAIQHDKWSRAIDKLLVVYRRINVQTDILSEIHQLLHGTIWRTDRDDIITILDADSRGWLHELEMTITAQEYLPRLKELQKSIQILSMTIHSLTDIEDGSTKAIREVADGRRAQVDILSDTIIKINADLRKKESELENIILLKNNHSTLERVQAEFHEYIEYTMLTQYIQYLETYILPNFKGYKKNIDEEIYTFTNIIKEQESLRSRYNEEIISLLDKISKQYDIINYIEMGLSPESGMPHHHVLNFTNAILENVNFVLGKIWSVPFRIDLLSENEEVTCDFKARCNNKQPTSLNKLSKSQKAAVNFAFYIALIYATGSSNFPVYFDELEEGMDKKHKELYLEWLKSYMDNQYSPQMWMVSHDAALYSGFLYKDITCLHKSNVIVPGDVNLYTKIKH